MSETDIPEALTKKVGPIPGWAWIVGIGVGAWGVYLWRRNRVSATPIGVQSTDAIAASASSIPDSPFPAGGTYTGTSVTEQGMPAAATNSIWSRNAANTLIAQGSDPLTVQNALSHYLNGVKLSTAEQAVINLALTKYGTPPEGVIATRSVDPNHVYTVQYGDTLQSIAQRYYGNADGNTLRILQGANSGITWDETKSAYSDLQPGQTLELVPNGISGVQYNTLKV